MVTLDGQTADAADQLPARRLAALSPVATTPTHAPAATGINAAVVGILAATWYHPVLTSAIGILLDMWLAQLYLGLLLRRLPAAACCGGGPGGWVGVGPGLKPPTPITVSIKKQHQSAASGTKE